MRDREFDFIRNLVYERSRISLGPDKRQLVSARLGRRLRATNLATVGEYCRLLQSPEREDEVGHLIDAISTNHTYFFRESAHFEFLRANAVPELLDGKQVGAGACFRVWSAACASGEEAYSIAMTLAALLPSTPWDVEGTDISRRVLAKAAAAIYPDEVVRRLPVEMVRAYFQRGVGAQEGNHRISPAIRARVRFHHLNLLEGEPPFSQPFHVIFCRNVMIYFDAPTQEQLVARLTRRLNPGGYLFVGHAESLNYVQHSLQFVRPAIYRKPYDS